MKEIFVKEDYSKKLKKVLESNYNQEMIVELQKYRGFVNYAFSGCLASEGSPVCLIRKLGLKFR